ncbi:Rad17p ASCRUDRAFT_71440 [Ascoidea rubescens DSM 1968]|uniref:DNA damage checkpoint control protein RAD17 n=1 Tax=Ascoidea rubescens DSM 1968 TaxID=1344418 RepID=A0A1D2VEM3_9ASCO|nr:hypothetical protein ASCRUDRAFT_71440 [Ascoidea rubescens DSM 1968]ODV59970.1 hypothetical protein ASCRUDRAFT_71440 [Ascoidea rubescens DSM 1968]
MSGHWGLGECDESMNIKISSTALSDRLNDLLNNKTSNNEHSILGNSKLKNVVGDRNLFKCKTAEVSHIASMLSAITFGTQCVIIITKDGLIFTTENNHIIRISINFDIELFDEYYFNALSNTETGRLGTDNVDNNGIIQNKDHRDDINNLDKTNDEIEHDDNEKNDDIIKVIVDLKTITESFSVASSLSKKEDILNDIYCTMSYEGAGYPFIIEFDDYKIHEICEFSTYVNFDDEVDDKDAGNNLDLYYGLNLNYNEIIFDMIINGDVMFNILKDLKDINTEELYIYAGSYKKKTRNNGYFFAETDTSENKCANSENNINTREGYRIENEVIFISKGELGYSRLILPQDRSILEKLVLKKFNNINGQLETAINDEIISNFKFESFFKIFRAIRSSSRIRFQKDNNGVLGIHLLSSFNIEDHVINPKALSEPNEKTKREKRIIRKKRNRKGITSNYNGSSASVINNNLNHNPANSNKFGNNIEQKYYLGTVIEFVLIESINDEDEEPYSQAKDKQRALKEIIMNADEIATINPQNRKRRRRSSRKYTASDNLGGSKASRRSNITKADTGQSSDIIKTKRDIAEILHNISVARSSGVSQHNKSGGDTNKLSESTVGFDAKELEQQVEQEESEEAETASELELESDSDVPIIL